MDYYINPASLTGVFTVPNSVVDNFFKFSKPEHIKVLLYVLRNISQDPENQLIASECDLSEYDVKEALLYWADAGIILPKNTPVVTPRKDSKPIVRRNERPTRTEISKMSLTDPKIQYLLCEAQKRYGRNLKDSEQRSLVWIYDELGLEISVILLIIQYAIKNNKAK